MSETIKESRLKLPKQVAVFGQQREAGTNLDHLRAFNFGRSLGRIETARDHSWLCFQWLLFGAAVGVVLAAVYLQLFLNARILQIAR